MCGLLAIASLSDTPVDEACVVAGIDTLKHRGPDNRGIWISNDRMVGLAHARLSIIDIQSGHQPLYSADGTIVCVVNGEFYEFREIRASLERDGARFSTASDSEILIHLYKKYGIECLSHLRGEFAFVLWDDDKKLLFSARDRFGIKPLYYSQFGGKIYFASEIKAIIAAGVRAEWDIYSIVSGGVASMERSLFKGVNNLLPGSYLIVNKGNITTNIYWDFDYPELESEDPDVSESEAVAVVRDAFLEAVRLRLHADVPVGVYLSGGIDSCSILGVASELSDSPVQAFTIAFESDGYNEMESASRMAEFVGANQHSVLVTQDALADHFEDAVWHCETPLFNAHGVAKYLLSESVRQYGYKTVLTGEGADEIFAGYPHFRSDYLAAASCGHSLAATDETFREFLRSNAMSRGMLFSEGEEDIDALGLKEVEQLLSYVPAFMVPLQKTRQLFVRTFKESIREEFAGINRWMDFLRGLPSVPKLKMIHPVHRSMYLWSKNLLPAYLLKNLGDRMEMAHSIEGRVPFLDHLLVEKVSRVPVGLKIKNLTEKYIFREAVKPFLPTFIYEQKKHPFIAPPSTLNRGGKLYQLIQDSVNSASFLSNPVFDRKNVQTLIDEIPSMSEENRIASDSVLTQILSVHLLQRRFNM